MRGPIQETRRIPHSYRQIADSPSHRGGWRVDLHPIEGEEEIRCAVGDTVAAAIRNAEAYIAKNFPGRHL